MKNDDYDYLEELLSYPPTKETRILILEEMKTTGKSLEECADRFALPPSFILDDQGFFLYEGQRMTSEEFKKKFPFRRFYVLGTKERTEKMKTNNQ